MSRGRKRKSDKGQFPPESMEQAVNAVLVGVEGRKLSLRQAAENYGLKFQTLQRYVAKKRLILIKTFEWHPTTVVGKYLVNHKKNRW